MKNLFFFIFVGVVCSCKNTQNQEIKKEEAKKLSKLEILYMLPKDSIYELVSKNFLIYRNILLRNWICLVI